MRLKLMYLVFMAIMFLLICCPLSFAQEVDTVNNIGGSVLVPELPADGTSDCRSCQESSPVGDSPVAENKEPVKPPSDVTAGEVVMKTMDVADTLITGGETDSKLLNDADRQMSISCAFHNDVACVGMLMMTPIKWIYRLFGGSKDPNVKKEE